MFSSKYFALFIFGLSTDLLSYAFNAEVEQVVECEHVIKSDSRKTLHFEGEEAFSPTFKGGDSRILVG